MLLHCLGRIVRYKQIRHFSRKKAVILGIESSCDDTGCAVVDTEGRILGEALTSQHLVHLNNGGIIPTIAQDLHRKNIENVVKEAVNSANISFEEIDAIATTVKPGIPKMHIKISSHNQLSTIHRD